MADQRNFDQKIFMFPPVYNDLREEMQRHWPELWSTVQWPMAWDAELFIELMNRKLDNVYNNVSETATTTATTTDIQQHIGHICKIFLTELRRRRGEQNP